MDSPPRKINPDSPKEICVKLTLSWSGIWRESWHDKINLLGTPGLWKRVFQRFTCAELSVREASCELSASGVWLWRWWEWTMGRCYYSGGISHLIALDLSLTFHHTVCSLWIWRRAPATWLHTLPSPAARADIHLLHMSDPCLGP